MVERLRRTYHILTSLAVSSIIVSAKLKKIMNFHKLKQDPPNKLTTIFKSFVAPYISVEQDRVGAGSLVIDSKKMFAIKHWVECTCEGARQQVMVALRDSPFSYGPWGETLSMMKVLFLKSVQTLTAIPQTSGGMVPLEGESTITLDWTLPMDDYCQGILFQRIRLNFQKATAIVEEVQDRRRYRMTEGDLVTLRNLVCLWGQVRSFLSTRMENFGALQTAIENGNTSDPELGPVLEQRPHQFAASFLPTAQQAALETVKKQEEVVTLEAQKQRQELRDAKWKYFQAALSRDQAILATINAAPKRLEALRHRKQMAWKVDQSQQGERLVKAYMTRNMRTEFVEKVEHGQLKINEYRQFVVT